MNDVVPEEHDKYDEYDGIEGHVTEEWPPRQLEDALWEDGAHRDHKQDIEDGRSYDRTNSCNKANLIMQNPHSKTYRDCSTFYTFSIYMRSRFDFLP